jgi:undecaprenyl-diphosphatase
VVTLLVAWLVLTGLLVAIGFGVIHSSSVGRFDRNITATVVAHRTPALNTAMRVATWLGSWVALVVTGVVLLVLAVRHRMAWLAVVLAVVAWAGENGAVQLAKHVVQRPRPPERIWLKTAHGWSWPSGHMAVAVLVFTVLALLVTRFSSTSVVRAVAWVLAVLAMATVGFSRIELGVHWCTDVIASLVFVTLWLSVIFVLFGKDLGSSRGSDSEHADASHSLSSP